MNVPLEKSPPAETSRNRRLLLLAMMGLIALVTIAAVASRWWSPVSPAPIVAAVAEASPTPTPEASPSPSPVASPRKNQRRPVKKKESKFGSFVNKVRRIFKR